MAYFARRYAAPSYFGAHYFPDAGAAANGGFFARRFFPASFYPPRYFAPVPPVVPTPASGGYFGRTFARSFFGPRYFGRKAASNSPDFVGGYAAAAWSGRVTLPDPVPRKRKRRRMELTQEELADIETREFLLGIFP